MSSEMTPADLAALTRSDDGFLGNGSAWWIIILFLFMFTGWGGNAWGNNSSGVTDNYVLTSDFSQLSRQVETASDGLRQQSTQIANGLCDGFYTQAQLVNGVNLNMANGFAQAELNRANNQASTIQALNANNITAMQNANELQSQISNTACATQRSIDGVNYNMQTAANGITNAITSGLCTTNYNSTTNTRDIIDNQNSNARAILDAINAQSMAAKDEKIAEQAQQINALSLAASQQAQNATLINALRPTPNPAYIVQNPYGGQYYSYGTSIA